MYPKNEPTETGSAKISILVHWILHGETMLRHWLPGERPKVVMGKNRNFNWES